MAKLTLTGVVTPVGAVTPDYIGQQYVDTVTDTMYFAVGATSADWNAPNGSPTVTATDVAMDRVTGSTYSTLQDMNDQYHSSGIVSGGAISDGGSGTADVSAGTGWIKGTDSDTDTLYATDFGPSTGLVLTNNDLNWIYVEYNAGTPTITVSLSQPSEYNTKILLGTVYRIGTVLHISNHTAWTVANHAKTMINRLQDTMPFARGSGGTISEAGTRNVAVSAGSWWEGLNNFTTSAKDTSVSGSFSYFYKDGASGWTEVVSQTQIDNTQYDDGSGTLATLANSRYGVHWLYLGADSDL